VKDLGYHMGLDYPVIGGEPVDAEGGVEIGLRYDQCRRRMVSQRKPVSVDETIRITGGQPCRSEVS
jgi:hypothetical protein